MSSLRLGSYRTLLPVSYYLHKRHECSVVGVSMAVPVQFTECGHGRTSLTFCSCSQHRLPDLRSSGVGGTQSRKVKLFFFDLVDKFHPQVLSH